jgi:phosphate transport system permease protein
VAPPAEEETPSREPIPTSSSEPRPRRRRPYGNVVGRFLPYIIASAPIFILALIVFVVIGASGFQNFGLSFWSSKWNPPAEWGILIFLVGSFITAIPALFFAMVIGLGIAIASTVYLPRWASRFLDPFVDLLAGIPSVVYGIWGYIVVAPYFGTVINPFIYTHFAFVPGFGGPAPLADGLGYPVTIFILTLMALPITTLLIRDALRSLPRDLWESGLGMGATRWEATRKIAIPYGSRGILSAAFLGFGRAFGETVAVAMVLDVEATYPINFYGATGTIASQIFFNVDSAFAYRVWLHALAEMALVLLGISLLVNIIGRRLVARVVTYEVAGL